MKHLVPVWGRRSGLLGRHCSAGMHPRLGKSQRLANTTRWGPIEPSHCPAHPGGQRSVAPGAPGHPSLTHALSKVKPRKLACFCHLNKSRFLCQAPLVYQTRWVWDFRRHDVGFCLSGILQKAVGRGLIHHPGGTGVMRFTGHGRSCQSSRPRVQTAGQAPCLRLCTLTSLPSLSEKAMAPHSSTLAWKIPWTEEPGRLESIRSLRVGHDWATSPSLFTFTH